MTVMSHDYGAASGVILNRHRFDLLEVNGKSGFGQPGSGERFCRWAPYAMDDSLPAMTDFHSHDLERTPKSQPR
jgi:hypothetical protein